MAVQFVNAEKTLIATMSDERDVGYVVTDFDTMNFVRNIPVMSDECIIGVWSIVKTEEAQKWLLEDLPANVADSRKASFMKGVLRAWDNGIDPASMMSTFSTKKKFVVEGDIVTEVSTKKSFRCANTSRFVKLASDVSFDYACYRWNRAQFLSTKGVKRVADGIVQFETVKIGDGSKVRVVMQPLELNFGMYSNMLQQDIEKLLAWDLSQETSLVHEAYAELLASLTNSATKEREINDVDQRMFSDKLCGIVFEEETLSPATKEKKKFNKSSKTQAKEYIQKKLGLSTSKLRSYVLN